MSITDDLKENQIQKAVFQNLAARKAPGVFAFHPKNGSMDMRGRGRGIHVGLGVVPGIPDVIASKKYGVHVLSGANIQVCRMYALELKRESRRGKKETPHEEKQRKCREQLEAAGWITGVAYGLNEALQWLENNEILKGHF